MTEQAELTDPVADADTDGAAALRDTLERMRQQATDEIARLNRKLAERELALESTVSSATERQAMQQELATLRHTLSERGMTLDTITEECRRLEDDLEDRHLEVDGLRQEVQRKENSLKAARDEVERLRHQLAGVPDQPAHVSPVLNPVPTQTIRARPSMKPAQLPNMVRFSVGLITGLAALAIAAVFLRGGFNTETAAPPITPSDGSTPGIAPTSGVSPSSAPVMPTQSERPGAEPPPTRRDRLRDGGLGPTMVAIGGGNFRMGQNSLGGSDSGPEREVQLAPLLIGAYEVTFQQYDQFARATGRRSPDDYGWGRGDRPVVGVSWSDAKAYADWLTRQTGKRYRLPSEAEWEFASRAGTRNAYPWGFSMEPGRAVCFDCGSRWDNRSTASVGSFPPNAFGLYDTAGNALEWVADCYSAGYDGAPADGRARVDGDCTYRVARGGAFNKPAPSLKTYARSRYLADTRLNVIGFRVARDP